MDDGYCGYADIDGCNCGYGSVFRGLFWRNPADGVTSSYHTIVWLLYQHYGDKKILEDHYEGLKAWTHYKKMNSDNGIVDYFYYGDWVSPRPYAVEESVAPGNSAQFAITPGERMSTGFYLWENQMLVKMAQVLGKTGESESFEQEAKRVAGEYNEKYFNYNKGIYATGSQACQVLPLRLGILSMILRKRTIHIRSGINA